MSFFPMGLSDAPDAARTTTLALRKLNLLDTNVDYDSLIKLIDRSPSMDTLLLRQMRSRLTRDGMIGLLERLVSHTDRGWRQRACAWKRLHLRILDVGDEFADLFPQLLSMFPVSLARNDSGFHSAHDSIANHVVSSLPRLMYWVGSYVATEHRQPQVVANSDEFLLPCATSHASGNGDCRAPRACACTTLRARMALFGSDHYTPHARSQRHGCTR